MAGPWEKYQQPAQEGPWSKYRQPEAPPTPPIPFLASHGQEAAAEVPGWKSAVSETARTVLPVAGGVGGGVLGTAAGPAGTIGGGVGGFAIGMQASDVLDEWLGLRERQSLPEAALSAAGNVYEGAKAEALGLGIAGAGGAIAQGAKAAYPSLKALLPTLTKTGAERTAQAEIGELLARFESSGDEAFLAQAQQLAGRVPGLRYTTGMGKNNPDLVSLERGMVAGSASKAGLEGVQDATAGIQAGNVEAIRGRLRSATTGTADDFTGELSRQQAAMEAERQTLSGVDRQATGEAARSTIGKAKAPIKSQMRQLYEEIPEYPVSMEGTRKQIQELLEQKDLSPRQVKAIQEAGTEIAKVVKRAGESTKSLVGARRGINDLIDNAQGNTEVQAVLMQVKGSLDADLAAVSALARTGKLKIYNGKPIYPDKLAAELEDNILRAADLRASSVPDLAKMEEKLRGAGVSVGRVVGETAESYLARTAKDYTRKFGEVPTSARPGSERLLADIAKRNEDIAGILREVEPGQDVAAKLAAYNRFAEKEYFGRFGTESVKKAENKLLGTENVTAKFTTQTGANDLIKAIGKPEAQRVMQQHYQADLGALLGRNPSDAQMVQWLRSNRQQLGKLGLYDEFAGMVSRQQGFRVVEKITKADLASTFDTLLSGNARSQRAALDPIMARIGNNAQAKKGLQAAFVDHLERKLLKELAGERPGFGNVAETLKNLDPTIQRLFSAQEKAVLKDVRDGILLTQRMTKGTPVGGSQTQELTGALQRLSGEAVKENPIAYIATTALGGAAGAIIGGAAGAAAGAAGAGTMTATVKAVRDLARLHGEEAVRRYFVRAMFDPEYARTLVALSKTKEPSTALVGRIGAQVGRATSYSYSQLSGE